MTAVTAKLGASQPKGVNPQLQLFTPQPKHLPRSPKVSTGLAKERGELAENTNPTDVQRQKKNPAVKGGCKVQIRK